MRAVDRECQRGPRLPCFFISASIVLAPKFRRSSISGFKRRGSSAKRWWEEDEEEEPDRLDESCESLWRESGCQGTDNGQEVE